MNMLNGFKKFILRGNVVDLAVGVVVGAAFSGFVNALVKDLMTPLIAAIFKVPDFSTLTFTVNGSKFLYGDFINAAVSLIIVSVAVYFLVVLPLNALMKKVHPQSEAAPTTKACPECATDIPLAAKRCPHCTSTLG
jgi:large conductance mechanosensitive channel